MRTTVILCLVTDRKRLARAIGAASHEAAAALESQVVAAARGGVDFVQVREPDLEAGELVLLTRARHGHLEFSLSRVAQRPTYT